MKKNQSGSVVSIKKIHSYEQTAVSNAVKKAVDDLGGICRFVKKGDTVLLKPNLLAAKTPETAATTHPSVVQAAGELVRDCGAKVVIGDSPAIGSWNNITKKTGMAEVADRLGAKLVHFDKPVKVEKNEKHLFKLLEISKAALEADLVINLPKLKTHTQMYLTLGVKNIFGCVVGKKKPQLHMEAGRDSRQFARMLVEIYGSISPALTIIDGIIGMEGNGPGSGTPKAIGLILASGDAVAMDRIICEIIGAEPEKLFILSAARELGYGNTELKSIDVKGENIESIRIDSFKFPSLTSAEFGPPFLRKLIKDLVNSKPKEDIKQCTLCNFCIDVCPPKIIRKKINRLNFNYDDCIRCYCCIEVCPEGAMKVKQGLITRFLN
ncbi:MAG: DUF362 domain-containing protein [Nitrospinota bacterium]|nr:DUF362 domain-containing protein [Nitrospinota bacterium]